MPVPSAKGETIAASSGDQVTIPYTHEVYTAVFRNRIYFLDEKSGIEQPQKKLKQMAISGNKNDSFLGWFEEKENRLQGDKAITDEGRS